MIFTVVAMFFVGIFVIVFNSKLMAYVGLYRNFIHKRERAREREREREREMEKEKREREREID